MLPPNSFWRVCWHGGSASGAVSCGKRFGQVAAAMHMATALRRLIADGLVAFRQIRRSGQSGIPVRLRVQRPLSRASLGGSCSCCIGRLALKEMLRRGWLAGLPSRANHLLARFAASGRPRRQRSRALLRTSCRGLPVTWPDPSRFASGTSCRRDRLRAARGLGTSDRSRPVSWRRWPLRRSICVEIAVKKQSRTNARSAELGQARPDVRNA
jgi:hypothetical protein